MGPDRAEDIAKRTVNLGTTPGREGDPAASPQNASRLCEYPGRLGDMRHAETDGQRIETDVREVELHRVAIQKCRTGHRRLRDVERGG